MLGAVGLYGVLSFVVAERTREIGVRMALGAQAEQVRRMVLSQGARVVVLGVALGAIGGARRDARAGQPALRRGRARTSPTFAVMSAGDGRGRRCSRATCRRGARRASIRSSRCGPSRVGRRLRPAGLTQHDVAVEGLEEELRAAGSDLAHQLLGDRDPVLVLTCPSRSMRAGSVVSSTSKSE